MGSVYQATIQRRTIRRFKQKEIPETAILKWIESARMAPSAANIQPCEYIIVHKKDVADLIFPCLKWAGYIAPEGDPPAAARPVVYVIVLINQELDKGRGATDAAAAIQNLILAAWDEGVGSCWLGSVDRNQLKKIVILPDRYSIDSVIALGYPDETPVVETMQKSIRYWKDQDGTLHVPKRPLDQIVHMNHF